MKRECYGHARGRRLARRVFAAGAAAAAAALLPVVVQAAGWGALQAPVSGGAAYVSLALGGNGSSSLCLTLLNAPGWSAAGSAACVPLGVAPGAVVAAACDASFVAATPPVRLPRALNPSGTALAAVPPFRSPTG